MTALLEINNALCRIGRHALLAIDDFSISRGQHWCVFGPNGAGKSLLLQLIRGQRIESGNYVRYAEEFDPAWHCFVVSFEEQQRLWERDNRLDISEYSPEAQDQGTTVAALIGSARSRQDQNEAQLAGLLRELGLAQFSDRGIRYLSSGQVRKALLARGLYGATGPQGGLLILDDPLESIDRQSRQEIDACVARNLNPCFASLQLCRRRNDIPAFATHLALMQDLKITAQGEVDAVMQSSAFKAIADQQTSLPAQLPRRAGRQNDYSGQTLIDLRHVHASYGEQAVLRDINWTFSKGEQVLIEGPNGCGKSTLLSLIDGDNHKAYGQEVYLFGQRRGSGESVWDIKARFGIVSNELHNKYVKGWRVLDVVVSGFFDSVGLYDDSGGAEKELARHWLQAVGLADFARRAYHELSFGQQRLVLLARAMVKEPVILILDEPCVGLDDLHRQQILALLDMIAEQTSTQLIYVSHVINEQPACINRHYRFIASGDAFTLAEVQR